MEPIHRCIVLYDESTEALGAWVESICSKKLCHLFASVTAEKTEEGKYLARAQALSQHVDPMAAEGLRIGMTAVIVAFWDGMSDGAKAVFSDFRNWAQEKKNSVVVQALNAKKGTHTLMENEAALITTLEKKFPLPDSKPQQMQAATDVLAKEDAIEPLSKDKLSTRLRIGQGECFWVVSAAPEQFEAAVAELRALTDELGCGMFPLFTTPRELSTERAKGSNVVAQEFMVRQRVELEHIEMRLAMCGNVDSGKSTITSVLTRGCRDDGRGLARAFVFNHKHELDTGRTSSVSENHLGFDSDGNVVNYEKMETSGDDGGKAFNPHHQHMSVSELATKSHKVVTLYDLAGHEKYLKTTVLGMTRSMPDYACIVVSANNGIQRMTKEHLGLCLALKLPFFIVVTRIDATPENVKADTMQTILKMLKMPTVKKLPYPVRKGDDVIVCAKNLQGDRITPIFEVSNVTGQGISDVLQFINLLPVRKDWRTLATLPKEMVIDSTFFVTGVGTVVGGIITQGRFKPGDTVYLGPDGLGAFRTVQIKSIHVKGVEVDHVDAGNDAALCLKKEKRSSVRKGNVMLDATPGVPKSFWQFEAEIVILYHSTTISTNYEPVIHSTTVRQSARIMLVEQDVLRTGDRATVRFHFLYRPEFMKVGQRMIFREGRTKGIGTVTKLIEEHDDSFLGSTKAHAKEAARQCHQKA